MYELKDHLLSCLDLEYINKDTFNEGLNLIETAKIRINGYINDTVDLMPLSENVELKNNNLRTPKPENID